MTVIGKTIAENLNRDGICGSFAPASARCHLSSLIDRPLTPRFDCAEPECIHKTHREEEGSARTTFGARKWIPAEGKVPFQPFGFG